MCVCEREGELRFTLPGRLGGTTLIPQLLLVHLVLQTCSSLSLKKGVAFSMDRFHCQDLELLANVTWWYDWGMNTQHFANFTCTQLTKYTAKFAPMVWRLGPEHTILQLEGNKQPILGFNEPNHKEQANMSPVEAAVVWPEVEKASHGRLLVSPAAAPCGSECVSGNTTEWFDEFFKHCHDCRIDYIATHYYSCNASETVAFVHNLYKRYGRPVWLTEFACPHTTSVQDQLIYMGEILPRLEESHFVHRYSWFASRVTSHGFVKSSASLLDQDSSSLTALGHYYISF